MSYCRMALEGSGWEPSDVYVYASTNGGLVCAACRMGPPDWYDTESPADMIAHLELHRTKGHKVPQDAIDGLREDVRDGRTFPFRKSQPQ